MRDLQHFISYFLGAASLLVVMSPNQSMASNACLEAIQKTTHKGSTDPFYEGEAIEGTKEFIRYLAELLESQLIGERELVRFIESLEAGTVTNPIRKDTDNYFPDIADNKQSAASRHYNGLQDYIRFTKLNREELLEWARHNSKEKERVRHARDVVHKETEDMHQRIVFHRIRPGQFEREEDGRKVTEEGGRKVTMEIDYEFDMMSTLVTHKIWSLVMGENPSKFKDGESTITMTIGGKSVKMQPDHPVERVSWFDIVGGYKNSTSEEVIDRKSFDRLSNDEKKDYIYQEGFLDKLNELATQDDPLIYKIIPDHQQGSTYRLPREVEWEYVVRNRGRNNDKWPHGNNEAELKDYAWYKENSNGQTQAVASHRKPLIVEGPNGEKLDFWDLLGNVQEWVHDWHGVLERPRFSYLSGEPMKNYEGPSHGRNRVLRGGSGGDDANSLLSTYRDSAQPHVRHWSFGFRLVRTFEN